MDGWMDGWIDGWMDGCTCTYYTCKLHKSGHQSRRQSFLDPPRSFSIDKIHKFKGNKEAWEGYRKEQSNHSDVAPTLVIPFS